MFFVFRKRFLSVKLEYKVKPISITYFLSNINNLLIAINTSVQESNSKILGVNVSV